MISSHSHGTKLIFFLSRLLKNSIYLHRLYTFRALSRRRSFKSASTPSASSKLVVAGRRGQYDDWLARQLSVALSALHEGLCTWNAAFSNRCYLIPGWIYSWKQLNKVELRAAWKQVRSLCTIVGVMPNEVPGILWTIGSGLRVM